MKKEKDSPDVDVDDWESREIEKIKERRRRKSPLVSSNRPRPVKKSNLITTHDIAPVDLSKPQPKKEKK